MNQEQRRTIRKNVDFAMAIIRTIAGVVSVLFNAYIFYYIYYARHR